MTQFDVYENPNQASRSLAPFVVVLQSDFTRTQQSVLVAPLVRKTEPGGNATLQRAVVVNGEPLVVLFASLTAIRPQTLGKAVSTVPELKDSIAKVVDLLFLGL
jgi:hypothetical protein